MRVHLFRSVSINTMICHNLMFTTHFCVWLRQRLSEDFGTALHVDRPMNSELYQRILKENISTFACELYLEGNWVTQEDTDPQEHKWFYKRRIQEMNVLKVNVLTSIQYKYCGRFWSKGFMSNPPISQKWSRFVFRDGLKSLQAALDIWCTRHHTR